MSNGKAKVADLGLVLAIAATLTSPPATADTSGIVHRFVLAAGANDGGEDRVRLQYAVSDADRFADVMVKMGGVAPGDRRLLEEPDLRTFDDAMRDLQRKVTAAQADAARTEVLLYYSGHADEAGLLLGGDRLSYETLRDMLDAIPADVRISVLDACASGAITRIKGGQHRPAFLVDASSDMRGYAFITSSSADEVAQESDRIGASFFTYYLVSGMRGAADVTADGKITLSEAYQFAFHETLAMTTGTQGGAQHPAYDINLSGTGDVVMTDVRETVSSLLLPEELDGRFYVRDGQERLVAELYKPAGRSVELGLEPGTYEILFEQQDLLYLASHELADGERLVIDAQYFEPTDRESTTLRGDDFARFTPPVRYLGGRSAIGFAIGTSTVGVGTRDDSGGLVTARVSSWQLLTSFRYAYWVRENVSVGVQVSALGVDIETNVGPQVTAVVAGLASVMLEARRYFASNPPRSSVRPFISGAIGAYIGETDVATTGPGVSFETGAQGAFAGQIGGGIDVPLNRHILVGAKAAYNLVSDFEQPIGDRRNFSGFEMSVAINVLFGKGFYARS